jgi:hypothetical protein
MKGIYSGFLLNGSLRILLALGIIFFSNIVEVYSSESEPYVSFVHKNGWYCLADRGKVATMLASSEDFSGVLKVVQLFREDISRVVQINPELVIDKLPKAEQIILIGTIDKNPLIKRLIDEKKLDLSALKGCNEKFISCVVKNPFPGVKEALIIAGCDKRGTIYGMFDLSSRMGVSPWYWWADVPVQTQSAIYIEPGQHTDGEPAVRYRGIFINDEAPALSRWSQEKFGGFNHRFYEKVFELLLRLKANYLWPAMWGNAFNDDDTINPILADENGIIMGTTHHEPMLRAQQEWKRYGKGEWNYEKNDSVLREFWRDGIRHMGKHESIISVGMRGDGDLPMTEASNIALLEKIVSNQRNIIKEVTGKDPSTVTQLWALYKEVQDYYEKGMRVPDDITLLLCDDNWGNIRLLPKQNEKPRSGGYGIYYHFDYVGGPRNYKWLNTIQIARVWEQMHLAYEYGADRIWIVNVGDIKPMELPISFFLDYAWSPANYTLEGMEKYTEQWAKQQFGEKHAKSIAHLLTQYTNFNNRRKPELLSPETFSLLNFHEADSIVKDFNELVNQATIINNELPREYRDAFFQLVLFPVKACANLNELYVTIAKNRLYAMQGRTLTNTLAAESETLFANDAELCKEYNKTLGNGKWNHMMDQTHIGYTYWQQPPENKMPAVDRISLLQGPIPALAHEGSAKFWLTDTNTIITDKIDPWKKNNYSLDLFNRGNEPFNFSISVDAPWLHSIPKEGTITDEQNIQFNIDWSKVPAGVNETSVKISSSTGTRFQVIVPVINPAILHSGKINGFIESGGYISMEAAHFSRSFASQPYQWIIIPNLGRTNSGVTLFPVKWEELLPDNSAPHLEYDLYFFNPKDIRLSVYVSPTQNFTGGDGLRYAVSFDNDKPVIINLHSDRSLAVWEKSVAENVNITNTQFSLDKPGAHILKVWMLDPGIVFQKLVIETTKIGNTYLGPPESYFYISTEFRKNK